ncbi:MAG: sulfatase-like hydrolase/transferase [Limisphaerales bacterium]
MRSLLLLSFLCVTVHAAPPNILLIVADDLGWGDVSYHGGRIPTPNLDRLAREGVELDHHYVMPQCMVTRSSLLSGVWSSRYDITHSRGGAGTGFPPGLKLLPEVLRDAGYTTLIAGKWHVGPAQGQRPWERGFEQTYGSLHGTIPPFRHLGKIDASGDFWQRNGRPLTEEGVHTTDLLTRQSIAWLREQAGREKPWFLYLAHYAPHTPLDPPKDWLAKFSAVKFADDPKEDDRARRYAATVAQLDDGIGQVIAALKETKQGGNTLVVFTSDNGPQIVDDNPSQNGGSPGELRGHKATTYEGGIRVPAFAWWPERLKPRKLDAPVFVVDWLPTFCALAGTAVPAAQKPDGTDVWPLLNGTVAGPAKRLLYLKYIGGMSALNDGDWKLVTRGTSRFALANMIGPNRDDQLFNIARDPRELHDLAAENPGILARMQALLIEQMRGDAPALRDGNMQYWWSRVPGQQRLIEQRIAEEKKKPKRRGTQAPD